MMRPFLVSFFLYQFALYGASAYLSLFMKGLGATPLWITGTFAAGVVCEVLVMTRVGRMSDALGRKPVLAVAFLLMPVRLLFYIPATTPGWVMMVQLLHGLNFGIMGAVAITYVNDLASDRDRGAAQASLASVGGLAVALGPALCGVLAQRFGIPWMFAAMSAVGALGAYVFLVRVPESHRVGGSRAGAGGP
ncbi:MAG: MFS transporter [Armatimonadetes bacterium]|nr:MFS transporter [Armatimonadota bacterium]